MVYYFQFIVLNFHKREAGMLNDAKKMFKDEEYMLEIKAYNMLVGFLNEKYFNLSVNFVTKMVNQAKKSADRIMEISNEKGYRTDLSYFSGQISQIEKDIKLMVYANNAPL